MLFHNKKTDVPITCVMCGTYLKHACHVFMECPFVRACWEMVEINVIFGSFEFVGSGILIFDLLVIYILLAK